MKTIQAIPPVAEMESLLGFIDFLRDPSKVEERAKQLEALRVAINEKIELVGKADEIEALRVNANADRQQASHDLAKAQEAGAQAVQEAEQKAARIVEAAEAKARAREAALADRDSATVAKEASLAERLQALEQREREATERFDAGTKALAEGQALKRDYDAKLAKLRAAGVA